MRKIYLKTAFLILCASWSINMQAQNREHFYTNLLNPFLANPAQAGSYNQIHAIFNAKALVGGIEGSPTTLNFGLHSSFAQTGGIGVKAITDWVGMFQTTNIEGAYSKKVKLTDNQTLNFGLSLGFVQSSIKSDVLNSQVDLTDAKLQNPDLNKVRFTTGAGLTYKLDNKLEVYFASPMLYSSNNPLSTYFVSGASYNFYAGNQGEYKITPMVNYYNNTTEKMVDVIAQGTWNETISIRTGYRSNSSVLASVGFNFKQVMLGYYYYFHTGTLNELAPASNEIMIAFNFKKPEKRLPKKQEVVDEAVIQDQIDKINNRIQGLIQIEQTNPGLVNVKSELVKINRDLEKILSKYKIENMGQLKRIKELQANIELLIAKYNG